MLKTNGVITSGLGRRAITQLDMSVSASNTAAQILNRIQPPNSRPDILASEKVVGNGGGVRVRRNTEVRNVILFYSI